MLSFQLRDTQNAETSLPGYPAWMAKLLFSRGLKTREEAEAFLHPAWEQIFSPFLFPDMEKAVALLREAKANREQVVVFGDYDVDGVCATAIMLDALEEMGIRAVSYLPDRHREGYGLSIPAVTALAKHCQVMITVDCGISCVEEIAAAKNAGMKVILTDHHRPGDVLPQADALISPLVGGYPFQHLCGAAVAWKLALALLGEAGKKYLELAALATVADMVSLTGENRALVALGLPEILRTERPGLQELMRIAGIGDKLTSEQVGYHLAPRMNACGRLETAEIALELLRTKDLQRAKELAEKTDALNVSRREQEMQVVGEAQKQTEGISLLDQHVLVIAGEGWNSGVVGLAAGRIAEKYHCPTVVLSQNDGVCVGSARTAGDVDLFAALTDCAELLVRYGGHKQAAGLTIQTENIPAFTEKFSAAVARQTGGGAIIPVVLCDGALTLEEITPENVGLLEQLEPFGVGNPAPVFLCEDVCAMSLKAVGTVGQHLRCTFRQQEAIRNGIFFHGAEWAEVNAEYFRVVLTPILNSFRGRVSAECRVQHMQLMPEKLQPDERKAVLALAGEKRGTENLPPCTMAELDRWMQGNQGTLLVCRCLQTALELYRRYPQADFVLDGVQDCHSFHTILLYGQAEKVAVPYRQIIFCDGDTGEAAGWQARQPQAQRRALPETEALQGLLRHIRLDKNSLRQCYIALRSFLPRNTREAAELFGCDEPKAIFALGVLGEIDLLTWENDPFSVQLLPMAKRDPLESRLYQIAAQTDNM